MAVNLTVLPKYRPKVLRTNWARGIWSTSSLHHNVWCGRATRPSPPRETVCDRFHLAAAKMSMTMTSTLPCAHQRAGCSVKAFRPQARSATRAHRSAHTVRASVADLEMVPDSNRRTVMNLLLVGAIGLPVASLAGPFVYFFVPKSAGGGSAGIVAKDALGNDVKATEWLKTHGANDRNLVQGLKADATYLIVTENKEIEKYGLNAVCTHLGCVVPWNSNENKFKCPCHGSQYNKEGKKVRGPAPLSLALAHCDVKDDLVTFTPWTETDFRDGEKPWWV